MWLAPLLLGLAAGAAPGPLGELVEKLEQSECDEAFELIAQVKVPATPSAELQAAARAVARGAAACKSDPALALSFFELASRLAPDDGVVAVAHVEGLLAVKQRGEAASLVDKILERHPSEARVRLMRGKLAAEEGEHELAVKTLMPLTADPAWAEQVNPLIDRSKALLKQSRDAEKDLAFAAAQARAQSLTADQAAKSAKPSAESGKVVATLKGKVGLGGDRSFSVKGLKKGASYVFRAMGTCERKKAAKPKKKKGGGIIEDPNRDIFGIDFAVQFAGQDPRPLSAGQSGDTDRNEIPFVADAESMTVRVFDRSGVEKGVSCTFTDFAVVTQ